MAVYIELATALVSILIPLVAAIWNMNYSWLLAIGLVRAVVSFGGASARKSLLPDVAGVAKMSLERANSLNEAIFAGGFAIGPAIAAITIANIGTFNSFLVVSGFAAISATAAWFIRVKEKHEEHDPDENKQFFVYAVQGFKILGEIPSVLIVMASVMVLAIIYLPTEMVVLPNYFNASNDPAGLGTMLAVMAFSTMFGSLSFEFISKRLGFKNTLRLALLGVGFSMLPISFLPPLPIMLIFGVTLGFVWGPLMPLLNTVIQTKVPANKRGRVFSLEMAIWTAGPMISMSFAGLAVDSFGVKPVYVFLAISVTIAAIFVSTSRPIRQLNETPVEKN